MGALCGHGSLSKDYGFAHFEAIHRVCLEKRSETLQGAHPWKGYPGRCALKVPLASGGLLLSKPLRSRVLLDTW